MAALLALFPTIAGWINSIIGYFQAERQAEADAVTAEQSAETEHQNDGAQSVIDQQSTDLQNFALDKLQQQLGQPADPPAGAK